MRTVLLPLALLLGCPSEYEVIPEAPDVDPGDVTDCGFTRVGETDFWSYDCNPVFTTSGEDWAPAIGSTTFNVTEVVGHAFYQMWYVGAPGGAQLGDYGLGYAVSAEGEAWQAHEANPLLESPADAREWNYSGMQGMQVVWDPDAMQYVLLYGGYNVDPQINSWKLGVATSPDGIVWTQSASNPVFDLLRPVGDVVGWCWPLGLSLGTVAGYTGYVAGYDSQDGPCSIYSISATSADAWQVDTQLVLAAGHQNSWYDEGFIGTSVTQLDDTWYMFFVGFGDWEEYAGYKSSKNMYLGWASSSTPSGWQVEPEYIPINQTAEGEVGAVAAHRVGNRIHLWVTDTWGTESGVGYFLYDPNRDEAASEE